MTAFEDHAKRASATFPEAIAEALPFGIGEELGVRRLGGDGGAVATGEARRDPSAVGRATDRGARLSLERMAVCDAGLLDVEVELAPLEDAFVLHPSE